MKRRRLNECVFGRVSTLAHAVSAQMSAHRYTDEEWRDMEQARSALVPTGQCFYCGDSDCSTTDHIVALVKRRLPSGCLDNPLTTVPCCKVCNGMKSGKEVEQFLACPAYTRRVPNAAFRSRVRRTIAEMRFFGEHSYDRDHPLVRHLFGALEPIMHDLQVLVDFVCCHVKGDRAVTKLGGRDLSGLRGALNDAFVRQIVNNMDHDDDERHSSVAKTQRDTEGVSGLAVGGGPASDAQPHVPSP